MKLPTPLPNYEQQVYAAVLGKVIGVYMGRPFEGWPKERLEAKWGLIDRYVNADVGVPLVVADDDISGTFTFVRALEDSGRYADTPEEFFGKAWLDYLIENRSVLWWGGLGHSTEHTAFLRLKHGVPAPHSGSIALNGRLVAEQIGAQIFIDAFGMVAPGAPELAATLARRAARVAHDGEAVHAATVVAAMVSLAFVEKDLNKVMDRAIALIPADSLIARVHRDVRIWAGGDGDWRRTFDRIDQEYGYHRYGGNCHVIPNHAIMVMAWAYAPNDFRRAQAIINTAGWDTDCNAANVGSVMGVIVGLDRICESYDFRTPFADRIMVPTADGTHCISDCLSQAQAIARIGRKVMGWPALEPPKRGAWHHFSQPGALHGYMAETPGITLNNSAGADMQVSFALDAGAIGRLSTPLLARQGQSGGYGIMATPRLYPGMSVRLEGRVRRLDSAADARLFVRTQDAAPLVYSAPVALAANAPFTLELRLPDTQGWPTLDLGLELSGGCGVLDVDAVRHSGCPDFVLPDVPPGFHEHQLIGWVADYHVMRGPFSSDPEPMAHIGKNEGCGVLVMGTTDWRDYTFEARVAVHLADGCGIIARYQGLQRYLALMQQGDLLRLVLRHYGETVLAEMPCAWQLDELHHLRLDCQGTRITAWCDGAKICEAQDTVLGCGGAGFVFENGLIGFRDVRVQPVK